MTRRRRRNYTYAKYGAVISASPGSSRQIFDKKVSISARRIPIRRSPSDGETARGSRGEAGRVDAAQASRRLRVQRARVRHRHAFDPNIKKAGAPKGCRCPVDGNTIDQPPFEAYAVSCGITFTFGGLRITTAGQVVDTDGLPIPGLYAAGELVGGLFYFNYPGGTGLMSGAVFGRVAGDSAGRVASDAKPDG